jgi:transketolase
VRRAFIEALSELAARDRRIVLLTGDLGFGVLDAFAARFPGRFINVGVAEQNMIGLATGLAEGGYLPFAYSISSFLTFRAYESIRCGPIMHRLPVRLIGIGAGAEYGHQGLTHYALEDIGVLRLQPELTVVTPADSRQASRALTATWDSPGPIYYRLGKDEDADVQGLDGRFDASGVQTLRTGSDVLFLATGAIAREALAAADLLERDGVSAGAAVVSVLNPLPSGLAPLLDRVPLVVTVEAHYAAGGLGSIVAEVVAGGGLSCRLVRCGFIATPDAISGSAAFLHSAQGLSREALRATALKAHRSSPAARREPGLI